MSMFFGLVGLFGFFVCLVLLVARLIHKKSLKKIAILLAAFFACFVVGASLSSPDSTATIANTETEATTDSSDTNSSAASNTAADSSGTNSAAPSNDTTASPTSTLQVYFINVGQADSILVIDGQDDMLIDAGTNDEAKNVVSFLQNKGVTHLDYVVGTHPHEDHIGGMDLVIKDFDIENVLMPNVQTNTQTFEDVLDAISAKGLKITAPSQGDKFQLGEATVTTLNCLAPDADDLNDSSIVLRLDFGTISILFTGDASESAEKAILASGINVNCDVLKVGHHGSSTATSQAFLDAVSPEYAVISCGVNNEYGHPDAETLNKLAAANVQLFRTDEQGTVEMTSDGTNITWSTAPVADTTANPGSTSSSSSSSGTNSSSSQNTNASAPSTSSKSNDSTTPVTQTYIINTNTKKFHLPSCRYVEKISAANYKEVTSTSEELIAEGYSPCKVCNP